MGLFNFSSETRTAAALHSEGQYEDLLTGETRNISGITVPAQGFFWLKRIK